MKLTKEECLKALESLKPMTIERFSEMKCLPFIEAYDILLRLIYEHFELVEEHEKLKRMMKTFK